MHPIVSFSVSHFDNQMYWLHSTIDSGRFVGKGHGIFMPDIVFVHRKGMDFKVRHGPCTEKRYDLLVHAWSLYMEREWLIN